jgi:hypothetical protein
MTGQRRANADRFCEHNRSFYLNRLDMFTTQKTAHDFAVLLIRKNMTYKDYIQTKEWFEIKVDLLQKKRLQM